MIRLCTKDDIPWLMDIAVESYPKFDVDSSTKWLIVNIGNPVVFIARGEQCAGLAFINTLFYQPKNPTFEVEFIVSRKTMFGAAEVLQLITFLNDLRKSKGYDRLYLNSRLADLSPFVKKLGGKEAGRSWIIED